MTYGNDITEGGFWKLPECTNRNIMIGIVVMVLVIYLFYYLYNGNGSYSSGGGSYMDDGSSINAGYENEPNRLTGIDTSEYIYGGGTRKYRPPANSKYVTFKPA